MVVSVSVFLLAAPKLDFGSISKHLALFDRYQREVTQKNRYDWKIRQIISTEVLILMSRKDKKRGLYASPFSSLGAQYLRQ